MRALVLAAGAGRRLRPYTDDLPKPMLEIGGRPILAYNLAMLAAAGFRDVAINLHYLPDKIRAYVGDGDRWGIRVRYSEEPELLGTAGALAPLRSWLAGETFALVFGDNLAELDLGDMLAAHQRSGAAATVALWNRDDVAQSGVAELDANDRVLRFVEKPQPGETESHWVNAGYLIAEPALLSYVAAAGPSDLGRDILPAMLADGALIHGFRMRGGHWWFDRVEDYERMREDRALAGFVSRPH